MQPAGRPTWNPTALPGLRAGPRHGDRQGAEQRAEQGRRRVRLANRVHVQLPRHAAGPPTWTATGRVDLLGTRPESGRSDLFAPRLNEYGLPADDAMSFKDASGRVHYRAFAGKPGYAAVLGDFNGDALDDYLLLPVQTDPWNTLARLLWNTGDELVMDGHTVSVPFDKDADVHARAPLATYQRCVAALTEGKVTGTDTPNPL